MIELLLCLMPICSNDPYWDPASNLRRDGILGDEIVSWDAVPEAVHYSVYCNDVFIDTTIETWFDVTQYIDPETCTEVTIYSVDAQGYESLHPSDKVVFEPWACFNSCGEIPCYEGAELRYPQKACVEE